MLRATKLSSGRKDPFQYDAARNMVLCADHGRGVSADRAYFDNHIDVHHARQFSASERLELRVRYLNQGFLTSKGQKKGEDIAKSCGYHEILPCKDGYCCPIDQCFAAQSEKTVLQTIKLLHNNKVTKADVCKVSWLWGEPKGMFVIQEPVATDTDSQRDPRHHDPLWEAQYRLDTELEVRKTQRSIVRPAATGRESLWYERTGWPTTFIGLDMKELSELCSLEPCRDERLDMEMIRQNVRQLLRKCDERLGETYQYGGDGVLLRRILFAVDDDHKRRAMERLRTGLAAYSIVWEKFFLFLVRVSQWTESQREKARIVLSVDVLTALEAVGHNSLVVASSTGSEDEGDVYRETIQGNILHISRELIEQVRGWGQDTHPLLYFLGIHAWDVRQNTWDSAYTHTSVLSHVIYCIRILVLEHIFRQDQPPETMTDRLGDFCYEHLHNAQPRVFDEVFSQRNYAAEIAKDFHGRPKIHWEQDRGALLLEGKRIQINQIQHWIQSLIHEAEEIMCTTLLGTDRSYLDQFNPEILTDHLTWETCGESLIDLNPKSLGVRQDRILARSKEDKELYWHAVWAQTPTAQDRIRIRYLDGIRAWQRKMGPLIFATGGGCPRATEVGSALWCNTQTSMRSYYVAMRSFLWVADYSKTERRTGAPRVIARFYPRKVGQMMIAYLSEIRPFYQLLCSICERQDESIFSDLFWHTDGKAWTAENFTPAFKETTKTYLGYELGTADWRHIHIALQQEILKLETEDEEVTSFALQNGHTKEVEDLHYALSVDMLRGLDERVMTTFLENSQTWHRFLGLEEMKPTSNPRKRGISDKTMSAIEGLQHTMTRIEASVSQLEANTSVENVSKRPRLGDDERTISPSEGDTWAEMRQRLHRWYPGFHWRSTGQLEAVEALVYGTRENDVIVQLPTGAGKSILIEISAYLDPGKTVIVVVPYRSLRDALVDALRRKGIPTDDFRSHGWGATQVVVIVLETWKVDHRFQQFVDDQATKGRLSRIIYDEAHLAILEGSNGFRPWAEVLAAQPRGVQRIFMSATLPQDVRQYLIQMANIQETNLTMIQQSGNVPGIQWIVQQYERDKLLPLLEELTGCHTKCLIYVKTLNTGRQIAEAMGWAFYQGATSDEEAADILQTFEYSVTGTLVATTALGAGMNLTVDSIICLGGGYDAITVAQQAGRLVRQPGRRGVCTLLVTAAEKITIRKEATVNRPGPGKKALNEMINSGTCRRKSLMSYLDDGPAMACQPGDEKCDICDREVNQLERLRDHGPRALTTSQIFRQQTGVAQTITQASASDATMRLSELSRQTPFQSSARTPKSGLWHDRRPISPPSNGSTKSSKTLATMTTMTTPITPSLLTTPTSVPKGVPSWSMTHVSDTFEQRLPGTAHDEIVAVLRFNSKHGIDCERCWIHGDIEEHSGGFAGCPYWWPEVPTRPNDQGLLVGGLVNVRVDLIRWSWKIFGKSIMSGLRVHGNCGFHLKASPWHPEGEWNHRDICGVAGRLWAIIEAGLQNDVVAAYLSQRWGITRDAWIEQAAPGVRNKGTELGRRLMQPVAKENHTMVLHQVALGILREQRLLGSQEGL